MLIQELIIAKRKYVLLPEKEYRNLKRDIEDLKKVFARRTEPGMEANAFFKKIETRKKPAKKP